MDDARRELAYEESLCTCGHVRQVHVPGTGTCVGEAQWVAGGQPLKVCSCKGFRLNAFEIRPVGDGNKLDQVRFNGEDITRLLSVAEVNDRDDEYHTWQLRLGFRAAPSRAASDVQFALRRIADAFPPYVEVTTVGMGTAGQWVLRLVD